MEELSRKLRSLRLEKNMTLQGLSDASGLSISFLSQVERGNSSLTITSLQKIAEALEVPITTFFEAVENKNFIVKAEDYKPFRIEGSNTTYIRLAGNFTGRHLEPLLVELIPNQVFESPYSHPGEEFYYVLEGKVIMKVADDNYVLKEGDAIHFPSSIEHTWENLLDRPARILCVLQPAIFQ